MTWLFRRMGRGSPGSNRSLPPPIHATNLSDVMAPAAAVGLIASGSRSDSGPAWSPDSKTLAFFSTAGDKDQSQLWTVGADGRIGKAFRVTAVDAVGFEGRFSGSIRIQELPDRFHYPLASLVVNQMIKRREFLIGSAVAAGAARVWGHTAGRAKMDRVAVMSYSFDLIMKSAAGPDDPQRTLDILDFPDEMAQRYGIHNLEIQHAHFRSTEPDYLGEFKNRLTKAHSRVTQLVLELGAYNISTTDPAVRSETIKLTNQWIDRAVFLSAARVMINQGTLAPDVRTTAAETLKTIKTYGDKKKVMVTVENRDDPPGYVSSTVPDGGGAGGAVGAPPATSPIRAAPRRGGRRPRPTGRPTFRAPWPAGKIGGLPRPAAPDRAHAERVRAEQRAARESLHAKKDAGGRVEERP